MGATVTPIVEIPRAKHHVLLVAVALLALVLRLWHLETQSATMDEVTELHLAAHSVPAIIHTEDGFPPLYHLLLKGWLAVFGPYSARWLSVVCGMALIAVVWRLGRLVGGQRTAWLAAGLTAISPIHVWYAQEARANILYYLLAVSAVYCFFRAMVTGRKGDWAGYGVVTLLGLYTHYYFVLLIAALLATVPLFDESRFRVGALLRTHAILAVLALPWLWLLAPDLGLQSGYAAPHVPLDLKAMGYTLVTFLFGFSVGPSVRELHVSRSGGILLQALPWAIAAVTVCVLALPALWRDRESRRWMFRLGIVMAGPIAACGIAAAILDLGFRVRYVAWGASILLVLLAAAVARGGRSATSSLLAALLIALSILSLSNRWLDPRYSNEDTRSTAKYLTSHSPSSRPLFVVSGYMAATLGHYLPAPWDPRPIPNLPPSGPLTPALEQIANAVKSGEPFWLVYSRPWDGDPGGHLRSHLESRAALKLRGEWPGVQLYEGRGW